MLKPLTFSVSLALALGTCSLGMAGHPILASGQCETPSAQCAPSAQSEGCGDVCGPVKRHWKLCDMFKHRQKCYTYEWVLKKKRCGGLFGHHGSTGGCDTCGSPAGTYASGQYPSGQYPTAQGEYSSPQGAAAPQAAPATQAPPAAAEPPTAPAAAGAPPTASNGGPIFLTPAGN
jgi:hypothetical protein